MFRASAVIGLASLMLCALATSAGAIDFRKPPQQRDLAPALQQKLSDTLDNEVQVYFSKEEEKKEKGEPYVDLQSKFQYLPTYGPNGQVWVSAKMGGAEYKLPPLRPNQPPPKGKGVATGKLKYLVFSYTLSNGKWVEARKPRWESQDLGTAGAKKLTADAKRAEKYKAAMAKLKARQAAAQRAMQAR